MDTGTHVMQNQETVPLTSPEYTGKRFYWFVSLSMLCHVLFFMGIVLFHKIEIEKPLPKIIQVDLVSFTELSDMGNPEDLMPVEPEVAPVEPETSPDPEVAVAPPEPVPEPPVKEVKVQEKSSPPPVLKRDIHLKTKPKNLKELLAEKEKKKAEPKTPKKQLKPKSDPEKVLTQAGKKLSEKIDSKKNNQLAERLKRMKQSVKTRKNNAANASQGQGTAGGGRKNYKPIDLYKMLLQSAIEQNWVFNDAMAGMDQNLEVRIMIKILRSGEIRDITYETRSGNRYLDESAKKAIKRANPLPELPKGMNSYDVVVIFTPKGLK